MQVGDTFGVNLSEEGKHLDIMKHFQQDFLSGVDVFNGVASFEVEMPQGADAIVVKDACAYVACQAVPRMEAGDHIMVPGIVAMSDACTGIWQ